MEIPSTLIGLIGLAFIALVTAGGAFGFRVVMNYIKDNVQSNAFTAIRKWAGTYVAALAQDPYLKGIASEEKKEQAVLWLVTKAEGFGISLSAHEASLLVEEAVWLLKNTGLPAVASDLSTDPALTASG
jgi:hypothetical protein